VAAEAVTTTTTATCYSSYKKSSTNLKIIQPCQKIPMSCNSSCISALVWNSADM